MLGIIKRRKDSLRKKEEETISRKEMVDAIRKRNESKRAGLVQCSVCGQYHDEDWVYEGVCEWCERNEQHKVETASYKCNKCGCTIDYSEYSAYGCKCQECMLEEQEEQWA